MDWVKSDINIALDGSTYPGSYLDVTYYMMIIILELYGKIQHSLTQKIFFKNLRIISFENFPLKKGIRKALSHRSTVDSLAKK